MWFPSVLLQCLLLPRAGAARYRASRSSSWAIRLLAVLPVAIREKDEYRSIGIDIDLQYGFGSEEERKKNWKRERQAQPEFTMASTALLPLPRSALTSNDARLLKIWRNLSTFMDSMQRVSVYGRIE
jgi:hypothetical protein